MHVLLSGASGLIGAGVVSSLLADGHTVSKLVRPGGAVAAGSVAWAPDQGRLEQAALEGFDAVVHLAGENIGSDRWTAEKKRRIRDSRVKGTTLLCGHLKTLERPPKVYIQASAIGYYGDGGDSELTEDSPPGDGFLAGVTREWEAAAELLDATSIRRVMLRIGVVLSGEGGALKSMVTPFRYGVGGRLGSGRQYMSWIGYDDVIGIIRFALERDDLAGPVNVVSPQPVTNREFTHILGRVLKRPTLLPAPAFALRLALGEMADELLLASFRAVPTKLRAAGYNFQQPELEAAMRAALKRS